MVTAPRLVEILRSHVAAAGFNICGPFDVAEYNAKVIDEHRLPTFSLAHPLGVVIGSSKALWPAFCDFVRAHPEVADMQDPLDHYTELKVREALRSPLLFAFGGNETVRFDWDRATSGRFCHMQTAAHFAGVAHYDRDVMWCVSPRYGVWCTFRVVVVFRISIPPELLAPLVPPQFSESEKSRIYHLTRRAQEEEWSNIQTLLDIREVCSVGLEHKYSEEQIEYHYSREYDRVLRTMLHNPPNSNNTNSRISTSTAATSVVASAALSSSVDAGQEASLLGSVSSSSSLSQPQPQQDTTDQSRHQQQPSETQLQKEQGGEQAQAKMAEQKDLEDSSLSFLGLSVHGDEEEWENVVPEQ